MSTFDETPFGSSPLPEPPEIGKKSASARYDLMEKPAIYANKFYAAYQQDGTIRLIFSDEEIGGPIEIVRTSIVLSVPAFLSLSDLLYSGATSIRKQQFVPKQPDESKPE